MYISSSSATILAAMERLAEGSVYSSWQMMTWAKTVHQTYKSVFGIIWWTMDHSRGQVGLEATFDLRSERVPLTMVICLKFITSSLALAFLKWADRLGKDSLHW